MKLYWFVIIAALFVTCAGCSDSAPSDSTTTSAGEEAYTPEEEELEGNLDTTPRDDE